MRLLIALILLNTLVIADQCSWNREITLPDHEKPTSSYPAIEPGDCLKFTNSMTMIELSSDGCACNAHIRISAEWKNCSSDPMANCDSFAFDASVSASAGGQQPFTSDQAGVAPPLPWRFYVDEVIEVPCGEEFKFKFTVKCKCIDQSLAQPEVCSREYTVLEFAAMCDQECDPGRVPEGIIFEPASPNRRSI